MRFSKLKGVIAPICLLLAILVTIYTGIITPIEASAVWGAGAFVCAAIKRRLNWKVIWESFFSTLKLTSMLGWMIVAMSTFSMVFNGIGALDLARNLVQEIPGGHIVVVIILQVFLVFCGIILDSTAMLLTFGPIFQACIKVPGLDPIWSGILFLINIQTALMSPPYATEIFSLKASFATLPEHKDITMSNIIIGVLPFALISVVCIASVIIFP